MKKALMLLAASMLLAFSTVCVSAEDYTPDTQGKYTVKYNVGTENAAGMYGMVAIKGSDAIIDTTNLSNIYYIDQTSANADGAILFVGFAPKSDDFEECTVFIGGPGYDTAEEIGKLKKAQGSDPVDPDVPVDPKPEEPEVKYYISGKVVDSNTTATVATVTVSNATDAFSTTVNENGEYNLEVKAGDGYNVVFTKPGYCSYTYTGVNVANTSTDLGSLNYSNYIGDVDDKGQVNSYDIIGVVTDFGKTSSFDYKYSDLNGDTRVNSYDLLAVIKGFGTVNKTEAFSASN